MDAARAKTAFDFTPEDLDESELPEDYECSEEHTQYILAKLEEARLQAEDPNTKWLSHEEVMAAVTRRREARNRV